MSSQIYTTGNRVQRMRGYYITCFRKLRAFLHGDVAGTPEITMGLFYVLYITYIY